MASYSVKYRLNAWVLLKVANDNEQILEVTPSADRDKVVKEAARYLGHETPFSVYSETDQLYGTFNISPKYIR